MVCHRCRTNTELAHIPSRLDTCFHCGAYLHCCKNCRFYDTSVADDCREPQAEIVNDKESGNFCEFFQPGSKHAAERQKKDQESSRRAFDDLFKH